MADRELKIARRGDDAALYIDGNFVCQIDNELVVDQVLNAVRWAYQSGFLQAAREAKDLVHGVQFGVINTRDWKDEREETTDG